MKKSTLVLIAMILSTAIVNAQRAADFCKKLEQANYHLNYNNLTEAVPAFEELVKQEPSNALLNYNLGFSILNSGVREKSEGLKYLLEAEKNMVKSANNYDDLDCNEKRAPLVTLYILGDAYMYNGNFDKAIEKFEKYRTLEKMDKESAAELDRKIDMCRFADASMKKPVKVEFANLGSAINTKFPDYAAFFNDDESIIYFNSRREGNGNFQGLDGKYFESVHTSIKSDSWQPADIIGSPISEEENDAIMSISPDGTKMLIYKDKKENGNIFLSELKGDSWTTPVDMGPSINSKFRERGACFSLDGNTIYFSSDKKGGKGGMDLYKSARSGNSWGAAENITELNTKYDETNPWLSLDGKNLFFSSNGHVTMGGMDLVKSAVNGASFGAPENLGYPINTVDDDSYYAESLDGRTGYVSQSRKGGMGDLDIYSIFYPDRKPNSITVYMGKINLNTGVKELTGDNKIVVKGSDGSEKTYKAASNGKFSFNLKPGAKYDISVNIKNKQIGTDMIDVPAGSAYQEIKKEFDLDPEAAKLAQVNEAEKKAEAERKAAEAAENAKAKPIGFKLFFQYNKKDIAASNDFSDFIKAFEAAVKEGPVKIKIEASASKVPTARFKSNQDLSMLRGENAKKKLMEVMTQKKIDAKKVTFLPIDALVGGPEYKNDFNENRKAYENFQYIDISVTK